MNWIKAVLLLTLCATAVLAQEDIVLATPKQVSLSKGDTKEYRINIKGTTSTHLSFTIYQEKKDTIEIASEDIKPLPVADVNSYIKLTDDDKKKDTLKFTVKNKSADAANIYILVNLLSKDKKERSKTNKTTVTEKDGKYTLSWDKFYTETDTSIFYDYAYITNDSTAKLASSPYEYIDAKIKGDLTYIELLSDTATKFPIIKQAIYKDGITVFARSNDTGEIVVYEKSEPFTICSPLKLAAINSVSELSTVYCFDYQASPTLLLSYWSSKRDLSNIAETKASFYSFNDKKVLGDEIKTVNFSEKKIYEVALAASTKTAVLVLDNNTSKTTFNFSILNKAKDKNRVEVPLGDEFAFFHSDNTSVIEIKVPAKTAGKIKFSTFSESTDAIDSLQLFTIEGENGEKEVEAKKSDPIYETVLDAAKNYFLKLTSKATTDNKIIRITLRNSDIHFGNSFISYSDSEEVKYALPLPVGDKSKYNYFTLSNLDKIKFVVSTKSQGEIKIEDFGPVAPSFSNNILISTDSKNKYVLITGTLTKNSRSFLISRADSNVNKLSSLIPSGQINKSDAPFYKLDNTLKDYYVYALKGANVCISQSVPSITTNGCLSVQSTNGEIFKLNVGRDQLLDIQELFVSFFLDTDTPSLNLNVINSVDQYETLSESNKISFINLESKQRKIIRFLRDSQKAYILNQINVLGEAPVASSDLGSTINDEFAVPLNSDYTININDGFIDFPIRQGPATKTYQYFKIEANSDGYIGSISLLEVLPNIDTSSNNLFAINQTGTEIIVNVKSSTGANYLVIRSFSTNEVNIAVGDATAETLAAKGVYKKQLTLASENSKIKVTQVDESKKIVLLVELYTDANKQTVTDINSPITLKAARGQIVYKIPNSGQEKKINLLDLKLDSNASIAKLSYVLIKESEYLSDKVLFYLNSNSNQIVRKTTNQSNLIVISQSFDSYLIVFIEATVSSYTVTPSNIQLGQDIKETPDNVVFKNQSQAVLKIQPIEAGKRGIISVYKGSNKDKCALVNSGRIIYITDDKDAHITYDSNFNKIINVYCSSIKSTLSFKSKAIEDSNYRDDNINPDQRDINYLSYTTDDKKSRLVKFSQKKYLDQVTKAKVTYYYLTYEGNYKDNLNALHFINNRALYAELKEQTFSRTKDTPFNFVLVAEDATSSIAINYRNTYIKNPDEAEKKDDNDSSDSQDEKFATWKIVLIVIGSVLFVGLVILGIVCYRKKRVDDKDAELL